MPLISKAIPSLINGVSQQVAAQRLASQLETQDDCMSSVVHGLCRRPPSRHIAKLSSSTTFTSAYMASVERDEAERYEIIITNGDLKVFDIFTGAEQTVTFPNGKAYLTNTNPKKGIRSTVAGDFNFIVNRGIYTALNAAKTPVLPANALLFVRGAGYAETYTVTVGANYWTMTLPTSAAAGTTPALEANVKTDKIAYALFAYLSTGATTAGNTFFSSSGGTLTALGYTVSVAGTLVHISKNDGADFAISANADRGPDHLKALKGSTARLADLPAKGWPGFTIQITGDADVEGGEFWVRYDTAKTLKTGGASINTGGGWYEVTAPDQFYQLNPATMPHVLVSLGAGSFVFKQATWEERSAGDDDSCPVPSFVGKRIEDVFFARGRLGFLAGENVITSRSGGDTFNFWKQKAAQLLDSDPIDIGVTSSKVALLKSAVVFDEEVVIFAAGKAQFRLSTSADILTPKTCELKPLSSYEHFSDIKPVVSGKSLFFCNVENGFTHIYEYALKSSGSGMVAEATDITDHVPNYLPGEPLALDASAATGLVVVRVDGSSSSLYAYSLFDNGGERKQAAWYRWRYPKGSEVLNFAMIDDELTMLCQRSDGLFLDYQKIVPTIGDVGNFFAVHLDRRLNKDQCTLVYGAAQNITTITIPYAHGSSYGGRLFLVEKQPKADELLAPYVGIQTGPSTLVVSGNWTSSLKDFFIGVEYVSVAELSEQFMPDRTPDGKSVYLSGRLQLRRAKLLNSNTLGISAQVSSKVNEYERGIDPPVIDIRPRNPDDPNDKPYDPLDPDGDGTPGTPDDPEEIDLVAAENKAYEALKTFDSNVDYNPNLSVTYLPPDIIQDPTIDLQILYEFPRSTVLGTTLTVTPNGAANPAYYFNFGGGNIGPFTAQALLANASLTGTASPDNYTIDLYAKTDNFYLNTSDTSPSTPISGAAVFWIGANGVITETPPGTIVAQKPYQGLWVFVRNKAQDNRVEHVDYYASSFNGTNWVFTKTNDFPSAVTLAQYLALMGRVTGIPQGTGTTASWPNNGGYSITTNSVSGADVVQTGTTNIGGGKFALTTDFRLVGFDSNGSQIGSFQMLMDGTAPSPGYAFNLFSTLGSATYIMLQRISTGQWVTTFSPTGADLTTASNAALVATKGVPSVTQLSGDYKVFLYAYSDASYYIESPTLGINGWWEHTINPSSGAKWGEVWYLPGGAWPTITTEMGTKTDAGVRATLLPLGARVVDQFYCDAEAIFSSNGYAGPSKVRVYGVTWDSRYKAELYVVGDVEVKTSEGVIGSDGTASFPIGAPGYKKIRVIEIATGKVIGEIGRGVGLLRSYKLPKATTDPVLYKALKERCFLYDQAVGIIAASIKLDLPNAERWTAALLAAQTTTGPDAGNFVFSTNHYSGIPIDPYYRTGATLWCVEALAFFAGKFPSHPMTVDPGPNGISARVQLCLNNVLATYLVTTPGHPQEGLLRGGKGRYSADYLTFDAAYLIPWISLEHNVDAFFAFRRAGNVFGIPSYLTTATAIGNALIDKVWVPSLGRLAQGIAPDASSPSGYSQDLGGALDLNSWGAIFLVAMGRLDMAITTLRFCDYFRSSQGVVKGYTPYIASGDFTSDLYASAKEGVWSEGTFGVVLARRAVGDDAGALVDYANIVPGLTDEGYLYTTTPDNIFELQAWPNVAGTAWAVICANPSSFWENTFPSLWEVLDPDDFLDDDGNPLGPYVPVVDPLNPGGTVGVVTQDGTARTTYTQRISNGKALSRSKTAVFGFPIHKKSTRVVVKVGSAEYLPFHVMSAEWEGFFTGRTQRIQ